MLDGEAQKSFELHPIWIFKGFYGGVYMEQSREKKLNQHFIPKEAEEEGKFQWDLLAWNCFASFRSWTKLRSWAQHEVN